jgi:hypothetical protein
MWRAVPGADRAAPDHRRAEHGQRTGFCAMPELSAARSGRSASSATICASPNAGSRGYSSAKIARTSARSSGVSTVSRRPASSGRPEVTARSR